MNATAQLIAPDRTVKDVPYTEPFTLDQLQTFVGGYIELVFLDDGNIMVVNEEGRLRGYRWNPEASKLAGCDIRGPALVCANDAIE